MIEIYVKHLFVLQLSRIQYACSLGPPSEVLLLLLLLDQVKRTMVTKARSFQVSAAVQLLSFAAQDWLGAG